MPEYKSNFFKTRLGQGQILVERRYSKRNSEHMQPYYVVVVVLDGMYTDLMIKSTLEEAINAAKGYGKSKFGVTLP